MTIDNFETLANDAVESVSERSQDADDIAEPTLKTTRRGALDAARIHLAQEREGASDADMRRQALRERLPVGMPISDDQSARYAEAYGWAHDTSVAANMQRADDAALDRELSDFRERPDVKFFGPAAERDVLMIWRDMFGARRGGLEKAYQLWHERQFGHEALVSGVKKPSAADLKTRHGALNVARDIASLRGERERTYRTPRSVERADPRTRRGARQSAVDYIDSLGRR